jgi:hypothetical protein
MTRFVNTDAPRVSESSKTFKADKYLNSVAGFWSRVFCSFAENLEPTEQFYFDEGFMSGHKVGLFNARGNLRIRTKPPMRPPRPKKEAEDEEKIYQPRF